MSLLDSLHTGGTTVVLVTHETEIAAHTLRRIRMKDGRIVADSRRGPDTDWL